MRTLHEDQHVRPLLSPEEAIARELIVDRVVRHHHVAPQSRRHARTALLLRRLAARLDPEPTIEQRTVWSA